MTSGKLRYNEKWIDCDATRKAFEMLKDQQKEYKGLYNDINPSVLRRMLGNDSDLPLRTRKMNIESIKLFASLCLIDISHILANGDGMTPVKDDRAVSKMLAALELIRAKQFSAAIEALSQLEQMAASEGDEFMLRVHYNRACAESLQAGTLRGKFRQHSLDEGFKHLSCWLQLGLKGAWKKLGKTPENEIHRMGHDHDMYLLLRRYRPQILEMITPKFHGCLPDPARGSNGEGYAGGCIPSNAAVHLPDGRFLEVSSLREGDHIISLDIGNGLMIMTRVLRIHTSRSATWIVFNGYMFFTTGQPLLTADGSQIIASNVEVGTKLRSTSEFITINSIEEIENYDDAYDLTTDHLSHNYVVYDGIVCHNKNYE